MKCTQMEFTPQSIIGVVQNLRQRYKTRPAAALNEGNGVSVKQEHVNPESTFVLASFLNLGDELGERGVGLESTRLQPPPITRVRGSRPTDWRHCIKRCQRGRKRMKDFGRFLRLFSRSFLSGRMAC